MWCCLHPLTFFKRIKRTVWWPADNSSPLRECAPCKVIRVSPESEKLLPVESKIPGFGICGSAQWIRNLDNYWKQDPKFHWKGIRNPVPGAHIPQRGIQNPRQFWGHLTWSDREKHLRISAGSRPWDKVGGGRSSRPWDEGGGGGGGGQSPKTFFRPFRPQPFPRSATENNNSSTDEELPLTWTFRLATFYDLRLDTIGIDFTTTCLTISWVVAVSLSLFFANFVTRTKDWPLSPPFIFRCVWNIDLRLI